MSRRTGRGALCRTLEDRGRLRWREGNITAWARRNRTS